MDKVLIKECWRRGLLQYKLLPHQHIIYNIVRKTIADPTQLRYVLNISRRWGKTTTLLLICIEECLRNPESQVRFACDTQKMIKKIILPIMRMLSKDAPEEFKPVYNVQDGLFNFHNGSQLHLAGVDGENADRLRGTSSDLFILDEAGFYRDLNYVLEDIVLPQFLTTDNGTVILSSTPPRTPAHPFYTICQKAEARGVYSVLDIYSNTSISEEKIKLFADEVGGYESTTWKREYLCQFVVDEELQVIKEWNDSYIEEYPRDEYFKYYQKYTAADWGFKDFTALIHGYYDFRNAILVIEDESTIKGHAVTSDCVAETTFNNEALLGYEKDKIKRFSDNNQPMFVNTMIIQNKCTFLETDKESKIGMVNKLKLFIDAGRLRVNPKCKMLIGCLKYAVWEDKDEKKLFDRSEEYGHFDSLDCLIYLLRNLDQITNPIPPLHGIDRANTHYPDEWNKSRQEKNYEKLLNRKKRDVW